MMNKVHPQKCAEIPNGLPKDPKETRPRLQGTPILFADDVSVKMDILTESNVKTSLRLFCNAIRNYASRLQKRRIVLQACGISGLVFFLFVCHYYIYLGPRFVNIDDRITNIARTVKNTIERLSELEDRLPKRRLRGICKSLGCIEEIESMINGHQDSMSGLNSTNFSTIVREELTEIYNNCRAARQTMSNALFGTNLTDSDDPFPSLIFGGILYSAEQSRHMKIMIQEQYSHLGQKRYRPERSAEPLEWIRSKRGAQFKILTHSTTIVYIIDDRFEEGVNQLIKDALNDISEKTGLKFVGRDNANNSVDNNTALIYEAGKEEDESFGCYTTLGVSANGLSDLFLAKMLQHCDIDGAVFEKSYGNPNQTRGSIIHLGPEWCRTDKLSIIHDLHALGLLHEQSRSDRDEYIIIQAWNLKSDKQAILKFYENFAKCTDCRMYNTPFNFRSIMIYPAFVSAYSKEETNCYSSGYYRLNPNYEPKSPNLLHHILCDFSTTLTMTDAATIGLMYFGKFNPCDFSTLNPCDTNAICTPTGPNGIGFPQCKCKPKFVGNGIAKNQFTSMPDLYFTNPAFSSEVYPSAEGCVPNGCMAPSPLQCLVSHSHCIHNDVWKGPECVCDYLYLRSETGECKSADIVPLIEEVDHLRKDISKLGEAINTLDRRQTCPQGFDAVYSGEESISACYGYVFYQSITRTEAEFQCARLGENCQLMKVRNVGSCAPKLSLAGGALGGRRRREANDFQPCNWILSHHPPAECWITLTDQSGKDECATFATEWQSAQSARGNDCGGTKQCFACQCAPQKVTVDINLNPI